MSCPPSPSAPSIQTAAHPFYEKHQALLEQALVALQNRGFWSPHSENNHIQNAAAIAAGKHAFEAYLHARFYLDQPGVIGRGGAEHSAYGIDLDISYPLCSLDALLSAGKSAMGAWIKTQADSRAGICSEIISRINDATPEIAHALMHTTGLSWTQACISGGIHAQDRALEAVANVFREMKQVPDASLWKQITPDGLTLHMERLFHIVPRGIALVIGCASLPTWHAYPGLFASLAAGNAVIVKPHPESILPLAITVAIARQTLKDAGFDANLVSLLVDEPHALLTKEAAQKPDIRIIDYAGNPLFADWLRQHARHAELFIHTHGINCIIIESTDDYQGMLDNLASTLALNAGQINPPPQTLFIPVAGIGTPEGLVSTEEFHCHLSQAIGRLLENEDRAIDLLGAIQAPWLEEHIEDYANHGDVVRASVTLHHPHFPLARIRTPLLLKLAQYDHPDWSEDRIGPVSYLVETSSTAHSLAEAERIAAECGALTLSVYSNHIVTQRMAIDASYRMGVALSLNLTDRLLVNQTTGYSDFQASGANPASNTCLFSSAFVARRFFIVPSRQHLWPKSSGN